MPNRKKGQASAKVVALVAISVFVILALLALLFDNKGYIDLSKIELGFKSMPAGGDPGVPTGKCPKISADTGNACCTTPGGVLQATVDILYVSASCKECPGDTTFKEMAPEGGGKLYMLCECNPCPGEE